MDGKDDAEKAKAQNRLKKQRSRERARKEGRCTRCCKNWPSLIASKRTGRQHTYCNPCIEWFDKRNSERHYKRKYGSNFLPDSLPTADAA